VFSIESVNLTKNPHKVLVCGGRYYEDRTTLYRILDEVDATYSITHLVHGGAKGADKLAGQWAAERGIMCLEVAAEWQKHGNRAGPLRNAKMLLLEPGLVVAFPGGAGTADMVRRAKVAGVLLLIVG